MKEIKNTRQMIGGHIRKGAGKLWDKLDPFDKKSSKNFDSNTNYKGSTKYNDGIYDVSSNKITHSESPLKDYGGGLEPDFTHKLSLYEKILSNISDNVKEFGGNTTDGFTKSLSEKLDKKYPNLTPTQKAQVMSKSMQRFENLKSEKDLHLIIKSFLIIFYYPS